jgi:hypothetical protein
VEFRQAVAETGPFGRRCLSILPCSPFPLPAHQTGRADFPHPAFRSGFNVTPSAEPSSHIQTGLAVPHAILVASPDISVRREKPRVSSGRDKANPPGNYSLRPEPPGGVMEATKSLKHFRKRPRRGSGSAQAIT